MICWLVILYKLIRFAVTGFPYWIRQLYHANFPPSVRVKFCKNLYRELVGKADR